MRIRAGVILLLSLVGFGFTIAATPYGYRLAATAYSCFGLAWTYGWLTRSKV